MVADFLALLLGFAATVITARWLGPSDRGLYVSIAFVAGLGSQFASAGLGEAVIRQVHHGGVALQQALSNALSTVIVPGAVGTAATFLACRLIFADDWDSARAAVLVACAGAPAGALFLLLTQVVNARERFLITSTALVGMSAVSTLGVFLLLVVFSMSVAGAILASVIGLLFGAAILAGVLRRWGYSLRPRINIGFARSALPYGFQVQVSTALFTLAGRVDLLLVYGLAGSAQAGRYSIALTLSSLTAFPPFAIAYTAFPRLAAAGADYAELAARVCRYAFAAAIPPALMLLAVTPVALPLIFGSAYDDAVVATLILVPSFVLASGQWALGRAAAANGNPGLLNRSYFVNVIAMCALDVALIPLLALTGAALASVVGSALGLAVCLRPHITRDARWFGLAPLLPTRTEFRDLTHIPRDVLYHLARGAFRSSSGGTAA